MYPSGVKTLYNRGPLLRNPNINCLTFAKNSRQPYHDNLSLFTALPVHLYGNENLEKETSEFIKFFSTTAVKHMSQKFKAFTWAIFEKWKNCCSSIFVFITLILLRENRMENILVKASGILKTLNCYEYIITFAMSRTSILYSELSAVAHVIHSFPKPVT